MILPPLKIGLTILLPVLKVNVIAFPVAPAIRSPAAIVNMLELTTWTWLPIAPDATPVDRSSSLLSTIIPVVAPIVGAPRVTPFNVTVTVVAALIGVPPRVIVIEDEPKGDALVNGCVEQVSDEGVTSFAKKPEG